VAGESPKTLLADAANRAGPETPTLAEKIIGLLHLPYFASCTVFSFLFSVVPLLLDLFLNPGGGNSGGALYIIVVFLLTLYFSASTGLMRLRIWEAEAGLSALLPDGEKGYHRIFGHTFSYRRQAMVILLFTVLAIPVIWQLHSFFGRVMASVNALYLIIMLGTVVFLYLSGVVALFRYGGEKLHFAPYRRDAHLGTRAIGNLSLSLASFYFLGLVMLIIFTAVTPYASLKSRYLLVIYGIMILAGLLLFFAPLFRVHVRMAEEKSRQHQAIEDQFDYSSHELKQPAENPLLNIQRLLSLDIAEHRLDDISTWPFDTTVLGKLSVILFSVIAALIARGLALPLKW
jgi:hypothetical protein